MTPVFMSRVLKAATPTHAQYVNILLDWFGNDSDTYRSEHLPSVATATLKYIY